METLWDAELRGEVVVVGGDYVVYPEVRKQPRRWLRLRCSSPRLTTPSEPTRRFSSCFLSCAYATLLPTYTHSHTQVLSTIFTSLAVADLPEVRAGGREQRQLKETWAQREGKQVAREAQARDGESGAGLRAVVRCAQWCGQWCGQCAEEPCRRRPGPSSGMRRRLQSPYSGTCNHHT